MNMAIQLVIVCLHVWLVMMMMMMLKSPFHMFKSSDGIAVSLQMVRVSFKARF